MLEISTQKKWSLLKQHANSIQQNLTSSPSMNQGRIQNKPQYYINTLKMEPSLEIIVTLKDALTQQTPEWLQKFIEIEGPAVLLDVVADIERKPRKSETDFQMQDECVACIRTVLNQQVYQYFGNKLTKTTVWFGGDYENKAFSEKIGISIGLP